MRGNIPRLRMFAGPNGSGKSTIKSLISPDLLGIYINPDEIEKDIRKRDFLDFGDYDIRTSKEEVLDFFHHSSLLKKADLQDDAYELQYIE